MSLAFAEYPNLTHNALKSQWVSDLARAWVRDFGALWVELEMSEWFRKGATITSKN